MDTKNLKAYAPQARRDFIAAVTKRAAQFGLYEDRITDVTIEGSSAIIEGRVFTRKQAQQRSQLAKRISELGFNEFINEVAFTWVNRLTAIRYMEVNGYLEHGFRILSMPPKNDASGNEVAAKFGEGFEILAHAADVADHLELDKSNIVEMLLAGDKEEELYREILLGECHQLSKVMPFMFEKLDDATELLLPDNLTKTDSILKALVDSIPESDWQDIEVIGWLYQFYISEHKDAVMGKVVKKEDIPAATQLFTPNWIVKYLVQNSLGRQWLETYPESELKEKMEYCIAPAEQGDDVIEQLKAITPTSVDPETIKVLDPACGSGHILVEVYEVLREIYLERGYRLREIPELILTNNIYGLDIDDRAAQMAAFAVLMKAREDDRRIFDRIASNDIKLNIHSLQSTEYLDINQLWSDLDLEGKHQTGSMSGLFEQDFDEASSSIEPSGEYKVYLDLLFYLKVQFIEAKNIGSLIDIDSKHIESLIKLHEKLIDKSNANNTVATPAAEKLLPIVQQAIILARKYNVVVANPPYMGMGAMNQALKQFINKNYSESKIDVYGAFILKAQSMTLKNGYFSLVTMHSWMFVFRFTQLRENLLSNSTISNLLHLGSRAFPEISGEVVQTCAFVFQPRTSQLLTDNYIPKFIRAVEGEGIGKSKLIKNIENTYTSFKQKTFMEFSGKPIIYWVTKNSSNALLSGSSLKDISEPRHGMVTSNNERFVRFWSEIDREKIGLEIASRDESKESGKKWFPYNKGGSPRKWYGNTEYVVNWENDGKEIIALATEKYGSPSRKIQSPKFYFKSGITWSAVSMKDVSFRANGVGYLFDSGGSSLFFDADEDLLFYLGILNSTSSEHFMRYLAPTININAGDVARIPLPLNYKQEDRNVIEKKVSRCIELFRAEYTLLEEYIEFSALPKKGTMKASAHLEVLSEYKEEYKSLQQDIDQFVSNIFEISSEVKVRKEFYEFNSLNIQSYFSRLISYSIGCMMGRYSLDREGLVYGHANNGGFNELVEQGAYNLFPADDDGIIPLASEAWLFDDDATVRFREFVKTVWGEESLQENLDFVAESLCLNTIKPKNGESSLDTIRRYLSTQFYKDHLKIYKKRPIYWLFSSGKEKAFECLVYLHRYNEGTLSRMRTEYVTPLMGKFESQTSILRDERDTASSSEQRRIDKELKSIEKKQAELRTFDEELKHISELKISLDLDDGVKANYGKFGNLLANVKEIHGKKPEVVK